MDWQSYQRKKRRYTVLLLAGLTGITVLSINTTGFSMARAGAGLGEILRFILVDMLPPDWGSISRLLQPTLDTLYMSVVAMGTSALVSFILAFFAAGATTPHPLLQVIARAFATLLRTIPDMVWVLLIVPAYGLGVMAGTIALFIAGVGLLTRAFAEALDEIDMGQVEALKAAGGSWLQIMGRAVMPQFWPELLSWSLFNLDTNVRSSAIIGMVGGGGLGFAIQAGIKLFQFEEVTMAILMTVVLFVGIEFLTTVLRRNII